MKKEMTKYGVPLVSRPQILATKKLTLTGDEGRDIIQIETKKVLKNHKNTFAKLAKM